MLCINKGGLIKLFNLGFGVITAQLGFHNSFYFRSREFDRAYIAWHHYQGAGVGAEVPSFCS